MLHTAEEKGLQLEMMAMYSLRDTLIVDCMEILIKEKAIFFS